MSIIKSGNLPALSAVQPLPEPLSLAPVISISKHDEERESLLRRMAKLEEDLRRRDTEIGDLHAEVTRAREEGSEQGYESGLIAAEDRQAERLGLLEKALAHAQAGVTQSLASLSRLAVLLAQDCVDIVLGNGADRAELISRIIDTQIAKIDRTMLVQIRLSRLDFPADADLAALREKIGTTSVAVAVAVGDDLASGACVMTMRLGSMSVGLDQQWPALRRLLDEMAMPEAAS